MRRDCVTQDFQLRKPTVDDGGAVAELVRQCPPLEPNTAYAYLLLCTHFAQTGVVAEDQDGAFAGFLAGYRVPERPDTCFVWQIGVASHARGCGLGRAMLRGVIERPSNRDISFIEATVAPSNLQSMRLFEGFAKQAGSPITIHEGFCASHFPGQSHEEELLVRIGPLRRSQFNTEGSGR